MVAPLDPSVSARSRGFAGAHRARSYQRRREQRGLFVLGVVAPLAEVIVDEMGRQLAAREVLARDDVAQEGAAMVNARNNDIVERQQHPAARLLARRAVADHFWEHAVVVGAHHEVLGEESVDALYRRIGEMKIRDAADRGTK